MTVEHYAWVVYMMKLCTYVTVLANQKPKGLGLGIIIGCAVEYFGV